MSTIKNFLIAVSGHAPITSLKKAWLQAALLLNHSTPVVRLSLEFINGRDNPEGRSRNRRALINVTK